VEIIKPIGVTSTDEMSEAARKILRFHFDRMVYHEPGTRIGKDIEELHDMRVATRRMRSAIRTFRGYYRKKALKSFIKEMRTTGLVLGEVRDMDVFLENLEIELESNFEGEDFNLSALFDYWQKKRDLARSDMIRFFDSSKYKQFIREFNRFLNTPFAGAKAYDPDEFEVRIVKNATPTLIMDHWIIVKNYNDELASACVDRLHKLRIRIKRLRYAVEFLREVLGDESGEIIDKSKQIQDYLGRLNDSVVASKMIGDFLNIQKQEQGQLDSPVRDWNASVEHYLQLKQVECDSLISSFPGVWVGFVGSGFEQKLFRLVSNL